MNRQASLKSYLSKNTAAIIGGGVMRKKGSAMMSWKQRAYFIKEDHTLLYFDQAANMPKGYVNISEISLAIGPFKHISQSGCESHSGVSVLLTIVRESKVMPIVFDEVEDAKKFCLLLGFICSTNAISFATEMMWTDVAQLLKDRLTFVNEERMGYFRSIASSPEEVDQENMMLQEQLDELNEKMEVIEKELEVVEWVFSDTLDVLKEPYVVAKNNLIQPFIEKKIQFLEFKMNANRRFLQQKQGVTGHAIAVQSTQGPATKPPPLSRSGNNDMLKVDPPSSEAMVYAPGWSGSSTAPVKSPPVSSKLQAWRQSVLPFSYECVELMRQTLPIEVFSASDADDLLRMVDYRLSTDLSTRFMTKKCLWILCLDNREMQDIDDSLLTGVYNTKGQNLDLVETAAVYGVIPETFFNPLSSNEVRLDWADRIQRKLRHMLKEKEEGLLANYRIRCPAYFTLPAGPPVSSPVEPLRHTGVSAKYEKVDEEDDDGPLIVSRVPFRNNPTKPSPPLLSKKPNNQSQPEKASPVISRDKPDPSPSGAAARVRRRSLFNTSRKGGPPTHVIRSTKIPPQPVVQVPIHTTPLQTETMHAPAAKKKQRALKHADI